MTGLLEIRKLNIRYGGHHAVRDLNLTIAAGETVALVGESGCGKSTSALSLLQLLPRKAHVSGEALFDGVNLLTLAPTPLRKLRGGPIGMIFQDPMTSLNPALNVGQQIGENLALHTDLRGRAARVRSVELLEMVEIPNAKQRVDDHPHQFSGGQRQRLMIAMAMASKPRLLIADEPTTALDVAVQAKILELLDRLKRDTGMGLLLITHDLGLVGRWADKVALMRHGLKIEDGPAERVLSRPTNDYTRRLLAAAISLDDSRHYRNTRLSQPYADPLPSVSAALQPTGPLLSVHDLRVHHHTRDRTVKAVDGVSFDIAPGESVGLVGESGCGKSTLSRAILRLTPTSGGSIAFKGEDITRLNDAQLQSYRKRAQMIFQDPYASLNPRQTVGRILHETLIVNGVTRLQDRIERIAGMLDRVQLPTDTLSRFPHEFSGGQRQRIGIARALLLRPSLLICDEPVSSLDLPIRAQVLDLLADLKEEFGLSYLFISHDLSVVRYISDRVLVMQGGRIVEDGNHRDIWRKPTHAYTQSLVDAVPTARFATAGA